MISRPTAARDTRAHVNEKAPAHLASASFITQRVTLMLRSVSSPFSRSLPIGRCSRRRVARAAARTLKRLRGRTGRTLRRARLQAQIKALPGADRPSGRWRVRPRSVILRPIIEFGQHAVCDLHVAHMDLAGHERRVVGRHIGCEPRKDCGELESARKNFDEQDNGADLGILLRKMIECADLCK